MCVCACVCVCVCCVCGHRKERSLQCLFAHHLTPFPSFYILSSLTHSHTRHCSDPNGLATAGNCGAELLVPIRLTIDLEGYKLRDTFMWNAKDDSVSVSAALHLGVCHRRRSALSHFGRRLSLPFSAAVFCRSLYRFCRVCRLNLAHGPRYVYGSLFRLPPSSRTAPFVHRLLSPPFHRLLSPPPFTTFCHRLLSPPLLPSIQQPFLSPSPPPTLIA